MSRLVFDIEGDELLYHLTTIWCVTTQDADSGEIIHYPPAALDAGIASLREADCLIGHNIIGYDLPAIWKIKGDWESVPLVVDTLLVSRALFPERYGGHSLEAWGERLKFPKLEFKEFDKYTPEMGVYCDRDVALNVKVLEALEKEHEATLTGFKVY